MSLTSVCLVAASALYAGGVAKLWRHAGAARGVGARQIVSFAAAMLALAAALSEPLVLESSRLFSVHMVQHELLMFLAAPLLVLSRPVLAIAWLFQRPRGSLSVTPARSRTWWRAANRVGASPAWACAVYAIVLWGWHAPAAFDAALAHDSIHALQHLSFLASAAWFWHAIFADGRRPLAYGAAVVYVFLTSLQSGLLGAAIALAPRTLYGTNELAAANRALADQQIAGLIMWIPSALIFIGVGLTIVAAWIKAAERRSRIDAGWCPPSTHRPPPT